MAKGLAALISVLGAAGTGYMRGRQMYEQGERQKARDAREDEEYEFRRSERAEAQQLKKDLAAANAEQKPEAIPSYDISKIDGGDPATQPTVGYSAAGQTFADQSGAQMALHGVNSRASKARRTADVLAATGNPAHMEQAARWDALAKQAIEEGSDKLIGTIAATQPQVDALKKAGGRIAGTVGQEGADIFNSTGARWKVRPDTVVEHYLDKDAVGREFVNSRVLDKDGKPVIEDLRTANLMLADYKTRLQVQQNDQAAYQRATEFTATEKRAGETAAEQRRHNKAMEGIQYENAKAARAREGRESEQFKRQSIEGQLELVEKHLGPLTPEQRKMHAARLMGLGPAKGDKDTTGALVDDLVKEYVKMSANPPSSAAIAKKRQELMDSFGAVRHNAEVSPEITATVRGEMSKLKPGTPEYADTYNEAVNRVGVSSAQLQEWGFAPPGAAAPASGNPASRGVKRIPDPPAKRAYIGNQFYPVTPAYAEWEKQYGATWKAQQEAKEKHLISGYERVRN